MPSAQRAGPSSTGAARLPPPEGPPTASHSPAAWLWVTKASTPACPGLVATRVANSPSCPPRALSLAPWALPSDQNLVITAVRGPARNKHGQRDTLPTVPSVRGLIAEFPSGRPREISCNPPRSNLCPARSLGRLPAIRRSTRGSNGAAYSPPAFATQEAGPTREGAAPPSLDPFPRRAGKTASGGRSETRLDPRSPYILSSPRTRGQPEEFASHLDSMVGLQIRSVERPACLPPVVLLVAC